MLVQTCPSWFTIASSGETFVHGKANPEWAVWEDVLELAIIGRAIPIVSERKPGTLLPARCPERHIESGGNFCLGLNRPTVDDVAAAIEWWEALRQHLMCQRMAHRTRVWPDHFALDHGEAGEWHQKALGLAKDLRLEEEYAAAHADEPSWLTGATFKLVDKQGRPINGRAPCHLGCAWRKRGRVVRRLRVDCKRRDSILELMRVERMRRHKLAEYWTDARCANTKCCETMRNCELRGDEADDPSDRSI
jgi:hypothetical protein